MARSSTDLPRMQNQARSRAPLTRGPAIVGQTVAAPPKPAAAMMRQYELVERVRKYNPNANEDLLNRAYVYAMKAHGEQKRASGDPYFSHPVEVAGILTGLKLDGASIANGLLLDDVEDTIAKMAALKAWGVSFSLDDFGTGYSSLSYIKRLPLDQLKIDQSFVRDLEWDDNDAAICAAIIGLAHSLGLKVVAEGVETYAQRYFLTTVHRCDFLQGYLFSKPLPLPGFEALLSASECTAAARGAGRQGLLLSAARSPSKPVQPVPVG